MLDQRDGVHLRGRRSLCRRTIVPAPSGIAAWYNRPVTALLASVRSRVRVGISLLTLVPGVVGGSETYARELCRALARVGELEYRVSCRRSPPTPATGCRRPSSREYRARTTTAGRMAAMSLARRCRSPFAAGSSSPSSDAIHFPLTVMIPRVDTPPRGDDGARHPARVLPGVLLARGARLPPRRLRVDRAAQPPADRDLRARADDACRAARPATRARPRDPPRRRPRPLHARGREREPFLLYPANRWPHKNHERLFDAFALVRRERPDLRLVLTGPATSAARCRTASSPRPRVARTSCSTSTARAAASSSRASTRASACRRSRRWRAGARSRLERDLAARGLRRRRRVLRPAPTEDDRRGDPRRARRRLVERGLERAAGFTWDACARAHDAVYRDVASA